VIAKQMGLRSRLRLPFLVIFCTSCSRAPSFDIVGSFFPAWILCIFVALLLTVAARWVFLRLRVAIALPVVTYPSLTALFTFALWLALFR